MQENQPDQPVEGAPEEGTPDTQLEWDKMSDANREKALQDTIPPEEPIEEPPEEKPPEAEPPKEEPPKEPTGDKPPEEKPPEEPLEEPPKVDRLYAGQYKTPEEMEKGHAELQNLLVRQAEELGGLRKKAPPEEEPDPMPELDPLDPESVKNYQAYVQRNLDKPKGVSKEDIQEIVTTAITQNESTRPIRDQVVKFVADHPEIKIEEIEKMGVYADSKAAMTGKPVTLEDVYSEQHPSTKPNGEDTKAIEEANKVPTKITDAPASSPATGTERAVTQTQWDKLPEAERNRQLMEVPAPPE